MQDYEIRIVKKNHSPIVFMGPQTNDRSAIRQAMALSQDEDGVEVWRDDICLYSHNVRPALPFAA